MVGRLSLVVVAVLVLGWLAVLERDQLVGDLAVRRLVYATGAKPTVRRDLARPQDAELLTPSPKWRRQRVAYLALRASPGEAAQAGGEVVRREPDDIGTWLVILRTTRGRDPAGAARAEAAIARLSPLTARPGQSR